MTDENVQTFKLVVIGDSHVGKSSIITRFTDDSFSESFISTVGVDFRTRKITTDETTAKLHIWDASGQQRFRTLIDSYCRNANGFMLVFDVTNSQSLDNIKIWLEEISQHRTDNTKMLLIGNKSDLISQRAIDFTKAKGFADSLNIPYIETSAKCTNNVEEAFKVMIFDDKMIKFSNPEEIPKTHKQSNIKPIESMTAIDSDYDYLLKLIIIGDSGVGKSSLLMRFTDDNFSENFISTIGVDFWDTAGQERFKTIINSYYRSAHGIILVFDVTDSESFDNIEKWLEEINISGNTDAKKLLVGNKCDLTSKRIIDHEKAIKLANSLNTQYVETSAKCTINVDEAFKAMINEIVPTESSIESKDTNIKISSQAKSSGTSSGFC